MVICTEISRTKIERIFRAVSISTFVVTVLTSIPLFVNYIKGTSPQIDLIVDLHVWFGAVFILSAAVRMIKKRGMV